MNFRRFVTFCAIAWPGIAFAGDFTGNDMHTICSSNRAFVTGFVAGWLSDQDDKMYPITKAAGATSGSQHDILTQVSDAMLFVCPPKEATLEQMVDMYCKGLADNPQTRHLPASTLLNFTLATVFHCEQK